MKRNLHDHNTIAPWDESKLAAQMVSLLALFTALLYLQAMIAQGFLAIADDGFLRSGVIEVFITTAGTLGLLATWRWPVMGSGLAILSGLLLALLMTMSGEPDAPVLAVLYGSPFVVAGILTLMARQRGRARGSKGNIW